MSALEVRLARSEDAPAIAAVHVRSWQWAYRGQIPDDYLDGLSARLAERTEMWRQILTSRLPEDRTWLAMQGDRMVGFVDTGPTHDTDARPGTAEIRALYLDPSAVGLGIGCALFAHAVDDLRQRHFRRAILWVLATNRRARRFYEVAGWCPDGVTKTEERPGFILEEMRYRIDLVANALS